MGAVLHMVNVRLSPEQILYTINHAEDDVLLVHADFLPMLEGIKDRIERVCTIVLLSDDGRRPATTLEPRGEYEACLRPALRTSCFPISTRTPAPRRSTPPAPRDCRRA